MATNFTQARTVKILAFPDGEVRTTPDKRVSVTDVIQLATGIKNPAMTWSLIKKEFPEILNFVDNFKFPGSRGAGSPVVGKEGFIKLTMVLPGDGGKRFREQYTEMILRVMEADPTLAEEIIDRQDDPEVLERLALRAKSKETRLVFTRTIQSHGGSGGKNGQNTFATVTKRMNDAVLKHRAKEVQAYTGQRLTRDGIPSLHLTMLMLGEQLYTHRVNLDEVYGHAGLVKTGDQVGRTIEGLCTEYQVPPYPPDTV